ncbi:MAG: 50S ribosomal protein L18 [Candidatus Omnitrophica bacterium]|nr:50S ribosomal protein L18 [Candidatus Omnitrophota bacterium]MCA9415191.1 50S ribosomal protein L18 [Candidatus Omnitrophota bacterium]MCA9433061.1 50S ribosomal protein L18 [Candidatus Omnitrophota bacterium]MCA9435647.1 50S ribosomal protein L18 [Candidatus Omnitrophota bacterium]MCA9445361.1 50S ribosomal protein L18 [Candidatus Omnitrophota bacterium]
MAKKTSFEGRVKRHKRIRKALRGTPERPRLAVFRSLRHLSAQVIDDINGKTICSIHSASKELTGSLGKGNKVEKAEALGKLFGQKIKEAGIERVVFDRGGFLYHGRVKAFADGTREAGVEI